MTKEQWLIYLWGIYPNGGMTFFLVVLAILFTFLLMVTGFGYFTDNPYLEHRQDYLWIKLGNWKWIIPLVLSTWIFLCNLVPNRNTFMYIVAVPYITEGSKSVVEQLQDKDSKLYKLNKMINLGLDKAIKELENKNE